MHLTNICMFNKAAPQSCWPGPTRACFADGCNSTDSRERSRTMFQSPEKCGQHREAVPCEFLRHIGLSLRNPHETAWRSPRRHQLRGTSKWPSSISRSSLALSKTKTKYTQNLTALTTSYDSSYPTLELSFHVNGPFLELSRRTLLF